MADLPSFKEHINSVHEGQKPHKCSLCDQSYFLKSSLQVHVGRIHEGYHKKKNPKKSLLCILCDKEFTGLSSFKEHINTVHEGKKPHKCSLCDQSYFLRYSLKTHIARIHEGIKPRKGPKTEHLCKICNSTF